MNEFTTEELKKIKEAINAYQSGDINGDEEVEDYKVVRTYETTNEFKESGSFSDIRRSTEVGKDWSADLIIKYQFKKGEPRVDLFVIDLGRVRAVVEF